MRKGLSILVWTALSLPAALGSPYTLAPYASDSAGLRGTSAHYTLDSSAMPGGYGNAGSYTLRAGYAGQLLDATAMATGIDLSATPLAISEGGTSQLSALLIYDDLSSSALPASSVAWTVQSGPILSISTGGLAAAGVVYQDTSATVHGAYLSFTDTVVLNVLNTLPDNFGAYALDQVDDDWQVLHFGLPPNVQAAPHADPDGDGQSNLFEFTAGLLPTVASSRLQIWCFTVPGQPGQKRVVFTPRYSGRTYAVESSQSLAPASWIALTGGITTDDGLTRTVTDVTASPIRRFYRVQITKP
jgi:hypothetical protein